MTDESGMEAYLLELMPTLSEEGISSIMYYLWHDTSVLIDLKTEALLRKVDMIVVCRENREWIVATLKNMNSELS